MPIINSYPIASTPTTSDLLLGVDTSAKKNKTVTFTVGDIVALASGGGGGGSITTVTSGNFNTLSVSNPQGATVTLTPNTTSVVSGGSALATAGDIYTFVTGLGYTSNTGTVTSFSTVSTAIPGITTAVTSNVTTPELTLSITGTPTSTQYLDGTGNWSTPAGSGSGTVESITATAPLTGGTITTTGSIGITEAAAGTDGYLSGSNFSTFQGKQDAITLTTNNTTGAATLVGSTLNIPIYASSGAGGGTVVSVGLTMPSALNVVGSPITTSGTFTVTGAGTTSQYIDGTGALQTYGTDLLSAPTNSFVSIQSSTGTNASINAASSTVAGVMTAADKNKLDNLNSSASVSSVGTSDSTYITGSGGPITSAGNLVYSLSATGSPSATTFLRGDNTWAVPAGGGGGGSTLQQVLQAGNTTGSNKIFAQGGASFGMNFADDTPVSFGASNDLSIKHSSVLAGSEIIETGTGGLTITGSATITLKAGLLSDTYATFNDNGSASLRHDNVVKFETSTNGIKVADRIEASTTNANLQVQGNGTGYLEVRSADATTPGTIQLNCEQNSHGVSIQSPAHSAGATYTLKLPTTVGTNTQVLQTDGNNPAQLSWVTNTGSGGGITSIELDSDGDATSGNTITTNGKLTLSFEGDPAEYINGEGNLVTFPSVGVVQSLTTNNTSGAATLSSGVLNIPQYSSGGGGGVTSVGASIDGDSIAISGSPITSSGTLTFAFDGDSSEYINGAGNLTSFPSIPTVPTNIVETITTTDGTFIDLTPNAATEGAVTITADLSATGLGAPTSDYFLRGDNTWAVPSGIDGASTASTTTPTVIQTLTQAEYDALTPIGSTIYVIV